MNHFAYGNGFVRDERAFFAESKGRRKPFSWRVMKLLTYFLRPSPKHKKVNITQRLAQDGNRLFVRKVSSCLLTASMTVEAAVVLPLFFFFFLEAGSAMEMIRLHGNCSIALWDVGNQLTLWGTVSSDYLPELSGLPQIALNQVVSYGYVKRKVVAELGNTYLDSSPIKGGAAGMQLFESEIVSNQDLIDLKLTYQTVPILNVGKVISFRMCNRYVAHIWNGFDVVSGKAEGGTGEGKWAYLSDNRSVYHSTSSCSHLFLTIRSIQSEELQTCRNRDGRTYSPCAFCASEGMEAILYIGVEGDHYHNKKDCLGLKRTYQAIPLEEAQMNYRLCERCAALNN